MFITNQLIIGSGQTITTMILYIKNMVSTRCKMIVKSELEKLGYASTALNLGEVEVKEKISKEEKDQINGALIKYGFEIQRDKRNILIEKIKHAIIEMVYYLDEFPKINFSEYLSEKLQLDYTYLSNIFSETQRGTIEHFIISHKIERVKDLLVHDQLSLTKISVRMNYSSVAHLSNQFKKVCGLTPSSFKKSWNEQYLMRQNM